MPEHRWANYVENGERSALRTAVADLASRYGHPYFVAKARAGEKTIELWEEAGKLGYLGVAVPKEYGGGGGGIGDLAAVCEELATAGCPLLLMLVSPAICATLITRFGTDQQRECWLPGFADGSVRMAFAISEPDAGSNAHRLSTSVRKDGSGPRAGWVLSGRKHYVCGLDDVEAVLVVARHVDANGQRLLPSLLVVPTWVPGFGLQPIDMQILSPERQFSCVFDDVRLPADALVGAEDGGLAQLFAALNPERIMAASLATGLARYALRKACDYATTRAAWDGPTDSDLGIAHPLAHCAVQVELARLMTQKAAALYDAGTDRDAGEAANMGRYAAGDAVTAAVHQAIRVHGGNGMASEYGLATLLDASRVAQIPPVSREMILDFVAQHTLGLPRTY